MLEIQSILASVQSTISLGCQRQDTRVHPNVVFSQKKDVQSAPREHQMYRGVLFMGVSSVLVVPCGNIWAASFLAFGFFTGEEVGLKTTRV